MGTNLVHGGKVSSVQFMDYTLGALFYRFISENITDYCNHLMTMSGGGSSEVTGDSNGENTEGSGITLGSRQGRLWDEEDEEY